MKRRTHRHSHRRVSRPAVFKQQVKRKEARKLAKYPLKTVYYGGILRKAHPKRCRTGAGEKDGQIRRDRL